MQNLFIFVATFQQTVSDLTHKLGKYTQNQTYHDFFCNTGVTNTLCLVEKKSYKNDLQKQTNKHSKSAEKSKITLV